MFGCGRTYPRRVRHPSPGAIAPDAQRAICILGAIYDPAWQKPIGFSPKSEFSRMHIGEHKGESSGIRRAHSCSPKQMGYRLPRFPRGLRLGQRVPRIDVLTAGCLASAERLTHRRARANRRGRSRQTKASRRNECYRRDLRRFPPVILAIAWEAGRVGRANAFSLMNRVTGRCQHNGAVDPLFFLNGVCNAEIRDSSNSVFYRELCNRRQRLTCELTGNNQRN